MSVLSGSNLQVLPAVAHALIYLVLRKYEVLTAGRCWRQRYNEVSQLPLSRPQRPTNETAPSFRSV